MHVGSGVDLRPKVNEGEAVSYKVSSHRYKRDLSHRQPQGHQRLKLGA